MKRILMITSIVLCAWSLKAQIERDGSPVSWNVQGLSVPGTIWQIQGVLDTQALLEADEQIEDKSVPLRFAFSRPVNYNMNNSGRWINLPNGDRLWNIGIESQGAYSIGITLSNFKVPMGAKLFVYSSDRSDFIGPLTSATNRNNQLMTLPPVKGDKIVIEYYEPYAFRGKGELQVHSFAHAYRDLSDYRSFQSVPCISSIDHDSAAGLRNASSSVMMMLVDNGQRIATATLINNTSQDGAPLALTARAAMVGNTASWVFLFNMDGPHCAEANSYCWNRAVCGAQVLVSDATSGLALLRLKSSPKTNWDVYHSGWRRETAVLSSNFTTITHSYGLTQSVANTPLLTPSTWGVLPTYATAQWSQGGVWSGAVGSPLFDASYNLIGVFVGGDLRCGLQGKDHFALIEDGWNRLSSHLDPLNTSAQRIAGLYANSSATDQKNISITFFPNPAKTWIYVQNDSDEKVESIAFYNSAGALVQSITPQVPTIDIGHLPEGIYLLTFSTKSGTSTSRLLIR